MDTDILASGQVYADPRDAHRPTLGCTEEVDRHAAHISTPAALPAADREPRVRPARAGHGRRSPVLDRRRPDDGVERVDDRSVVRRGRHGRRAQPTHGDVLRDGRVLVVGAIGGGFPGPDPRRTAEVYDPASNTWSATGQLTAPRTDHVAVRLADGRVLVAGSDYYRTAEMCDIIPSTAAEIFSP